MTATDELRAKLTKRGVEYEVDDGKTVRVTRWKAYGEWVSFIEYDTGETRFCTDMRRFTPAQAIAATLGRGTLTAEQVSRATYAHSIHADCADADWQAIADELNVTLGSEDTYTREDVEGAFVSGYSLGLDMFDSSKTEKGWDQNERNLDEEMEDLGWVHKDAATPDAGTCEADETDLIPFVRADSGDLEVDYIHVMECSACGGTYEHVNGSYEFCPRCRRRVVDE